jgi:hypothetical protein
MAYNPALQQAAARVARRAKNGSRTVWTPGQVTMDLHLGKIGDVNPFRGVAEFHWSDESFGNSSNVLRYLQTSGPGNLPATGHDAWVLQYDNDYMILGQHVVPDSIVIPT